MKTVNFGGWIFYYSTVELSNLDDNKVGKWIIYFNDVNWAKDTCTQAITNNIIHTCKHSDNDNGIICFYLNFDDIASHKKLINWLINKNMIQKTKDGKYYNISFKLDEQTLSNQYGKDFKPSIKLSDFIDLKTGIFIR